MFLLFFLYVFVKNFHVSGFIRLFPLLWGSLLEKGWPLAASPELVRNVSAMCPPRVRLVPALSPLWPRLQTLSAMWPTCVSDVSALSPLWLRVQTLSAMCPPGLLSTMCPIKPWPCLWTLSALGLLWGSAVASSSKNSFPPLRNPQRQRVYIASPLVSSLHIFILALASTPHAWKNVLGSMLVLLPRKFTVGFSFRRKRLAAMCSGHVPGACPPCVRYVPALCPPRVCLVSALSPLWPGLQTSSAM